MMTIQKRFPIFLLTVMLVVSGCFGPSRNLPPVTRTFDSHAVGSNAQWKIYQDVENRFNITYPADWVPLPSAESTDTIHFIEMADATNGAQSAVTVIVRDTTYNLNRVVASSEQTIRQQSGVSRFEVLEERGVAVNGIRGIEQLLRYSLRGTELNNRIIYLRHPNYLFSLSLTYPEQSTADVTSVFEEIVRSFTVPDELRS